jgi:uncharacterized membrane protein
VAVVAFCRWSWQLTGMSNLTPPSLPPTTPRRAGGCLIAAGLMLGAAIGVMAGQPSAGLLIGLAIGVAGAVGMTLMDRR